MTMFAIYPSTSDGVTQAKPVAMFRQQDVAKAWAATTYGERGFVLKELEITRCDVVGRSPMVLTGAG